MMYSGQLQRNTGTVRNSSCLNCPNFSICKQNALSKQKLHKIYHVRFVFIMCSWQTDREMITCDASRCILSDDGSTVTITSQNARGTMLYAVNLVGLYPLPQHDYVKYWVTEPGSVQCTENSTETTEEFGTRQPPWFYGSAEVNAACNESRWVEMTAEVSQSIGGLEEVGNLTSKEFIHSVCSL